MPLSVRRLSATSVMADELADAMGWKNDAPFDVERLATMSDAALLSYLHEQAAGYPVEVLELMRRFEAVRERSRAG